MARMLEVCICLADALTSNTILLFSHFVQLKSRDLKDFLLGSGYASIELWEFFCNHFVL